METEGSLPHSQMPATCLYPEPDRFSPYSHIPLPADSPYYYPPIYAWVFQVVSIPQVSSPKPCIYHLSSPQYITSSYCENQQFCILCHNYIILHYYLHQQSFGKIWMHITATNLMGRRSVQSKDSSYMKGLFGQSKAATGSLRMLNSVSLPG
jgi:hypothetical protein